MPDPSVRRCYALLCVAMRCYALLCVAMRCYALLCVAMLIADRFVFIGYLYELRRQHLFDLLRLRNDRDPVMYSHRQNVPTAFFIETAGCC